MRSSISLSSFFAENHRKMYPEQYESAQQEAEASRAARTAVDPLSLSPMRQAALLQMYESHVRRAVIGRLLEDSQDKPSTLDYRALCDIGLCERNDGKRYHDLTREGREAARVLQLALCQRFDIHLLIEGGATGSQVRWSCCCGFSTLVRRSTTARGNAGQQHRAHVSRKQTSEMFAAMKPPQMAEG